MGFTDAVSVGIEVILRCQSDGRRSLRAALSNRYRADNRRETGRTFPYMERPHA